MYKTPNRRLLFVLILVASQMLLTAHGFENHGKAGLSQCEFCVAQGGGDAALLPESCWLSSPAQSIEFTDSHSTTTTAANAYPAWTQRGPPVLN